MKFLISSKYLYQQLKKHESILNKINKILLKDGEVSLLGYTIDSIVFSAEFYEEGAFWSDCRWDWLLETVRNIHERPVVIQVHHNKLRLIIDF